MKNGLFFGLLAGIIYMIWIVVGGNIFPNLVYGSISSIIISSILAIIFMFLACQKEEAALDSSLRFGEAFLVCLTTYAVLNIIYGIGFKLYVESSLTAMANFVEITKASTADIMTKMGAPEDEIYKSMEELEESLPTIFSWKATFLTIFGGIVFPGALLALIVAALFSKFSTKQPTV